MEEARKILVESDGYKINIIHQLFIKPFEFKRVANALNNSKYGGLVLDDDYEEGVASSLFYQLMLRSEKKSFDSRSNKNLQAFMQMLIIFLPLQKKYTGK